MALKLANNAASTLASALSAASTSMTLTTGGGSAFPTLGTNDYTFATLISAANPNIVEIVKVTAISGDVFTIVRGQDGTTALNWNANDLVQTRPTGGAVTSRQSATTVYAGNPNTHVAGDLYDMVWDSTHSVLWECTTAGLAAAAVWTMVSAKTLNNTLDNGSGAMTIAGSFTVSAGGVSITGGGTLNGDYKGDGSVPSGLSGKSGLETVMLNTPVLIATGLPAGSTTTVNIGTSYPNAKIAVLRIHLAVQGTSVGGFGYFYAARSGLTTIGTYEHGFITCPDTSNVYVQYVHLLMPLVTGSNPSFQIHPVQTNATISSSDVYLDGFIQ